MGAEFKPKIATILPVLNEQAYITECLDSLINQTYAAANHSILVLDGGSTDQTTQLVHSAIQRSADCDGPAIQLYNNPGKFVAQGRNLAMSLLPEGTTHVLELIGHSTVGPEHLEHLVNEWTTISNDESKPLAALGSRVVSRVGELKRVESWIEATLCSPLGSGGGQFDSFTIASPTRIPAFVLHDRHALETVGGWDESFISSQDSDLSMRLLEAGFALWRTPRTTVHMTKRTGLTRWWRMGHRYGFWRTRTVLKHPGRISLREYLPWFGLLLTFTLLMVKSEYAFVPFAMYAVVLSLEGVRMMIRFRRPSLLIGLPLCMMMLHTSFSIGLLDGLFRKGGAASDR